MKFGLFTEGDTNRGYSVTQRYDEMIREAQYAELEKAHRRSRG
jgi:hypothetical protein